MRSFGGKVPAGDRAPASDTDTSTKTDFPRVLVAIKDESQIEHAVELARRAGATEARILHLNLRESFGGRRYPLETESSAASLVETAVLEFRVAGIMATGQVRHALVDRVAQAIAADASEWGADLIVLGIPRRRRLATRLFGSVALRVQQQAPCPVLVPSAADKDLLHRHGQSATSVTGSDLGTGTRSLSATPLR
jgi:nucleotide-binding universal stress UspA family protein